MELTGKDKKRYFSVLEGLKSFHKQFNYDDNDRAIVIVGVAYIEDLLLYCLENFFPSKSSTVERMLSYKGIVGTYVAKVELLYSLGLIDKVIKQDLEILAQIRNVYAHQTIVSFEDKKITTLCSGLRFHETLLMMKAPSEATSKEVFKVGLNTLVSHLNGIASIARMEKKK